MTPRVFVKTFRSITRTSKLPCHLDGSATSCKSIVYEEMPF